MIASAVGALRLVNARDHLLSVLSIAKLESAAVNISGVSPGVSRVVLESFVARSGAGGRADIMAGRKQHHSAAQSGSCVSRATTGISSLPLE